MASDITDILNAIKTGQFGGTSTSDVIGGSNFSGLENIIPGLWNEAIGGVEPQHPLYVSGDEWKQLPTDGADLSDLQHALINAGYMSGDNIVFGSPDAKTASAMGELLGSSNASGTVWQTTLAKRLAMAAQQPPPTKSRAPLVIKLRSDDDLRGILQEGSHNLFGQYMSPDDVQKFIDAYHSQQSTYQTASYQATGYNPDTGQQDLNAAGQPTVQGTTLTAPPETSAGINAAFERQFTAEHPSEAGISIFSDTLHKILAELK